MDLSEIDAQLDALGEEPAHTEALRERHRPPELEPALQAQRSHGERMEAVDACLNELQVGAEPVERPRSLRPTPAARPVPAQRTLPPAEPNLDPPAVEALPQHLGRSEPAPAPVVDADDDPLPLPSLQGHTLPAASQALEVGLEGAQSTTQGGQSAPPIDLPADFEAAYNGQSEPSRFPPIPPPPPLASGLGTVPPPAPLPRPGALLPPPPQSGLSEPPRGSSSQRPILSPVPPPVPSSLPRPTREPRLIASVQDAPGDAPASAAQPPPPPPAHVHPQVRSIAPPPLPASVKPPPLPRSARPTRAAVGSSLPPRGDQTAEVDLTEFIEVDD